MVCGENEESLGHGKKSTINSRKPRHHNNLADQCNMEHLK